MGREKRAAQSRSQDTLEKTGRGIPEAPNSSVAAAAAHHEGHAGTSTGKAIFQIICLYLVPILLVIVVGKLFLKL
jgi:hypothetical protein